MKRAIAAFLALTLVALAPGTGTYQALAQVAARGGNAASSIRVSPSALGAAAPLAPTMGLPLSGPSFNLTLPSPTAAAPHAAPTRTAAAAVAAMTAPAASPAAASAAAIPAAARNTAVKQRPVDTIGNAIGQMAREAAPMSDTARKGSATDARAAGVALENLLSGRARPSAEDSLVPTARALPAARSNLGTASGMSAPSQSASPISPAARAAAKESVLRHGLGRAYQAVAKSLKRTLFAFTMAAFTLGVPFGAGSVVPDLIAERTARAAIAAQAVLPGIQVPAAQVPIQAAPAVVQQAPIAVEVAVQGQGVTLGEAMTLTVTIRNLSGAAVAVPSVRAALEEALPFTLEIRGDAGSAPLALAAGETKVLTFTIIPFDAGKIVLEGALLAFPTADPEKPLLVQIPPATFEVASVLTPDWKEKGFKDLAELRRGETPSILWLLALPVALLALAGAERLLSSRRNGREPNIYNGPALDGARTRLERLERGRETLAAAEFYGETLTLLHRLLSDLRGLPRRERSSTQLLKEAADKYTSGQLSVAGKTMDAAEAALYGNGADSPEGRRQVLTQLRALIADLGEKPQAAAAPSGLAGIAALMGGVTLSFAHPWALLLAAPIIIWAAYKWRTNKTAGWATTAPQPAKVGWRARLRWVPSIFRASAIALALLAVAGPQIGVKRSETYIPSTDTVIASDVSGSMSGERLDGLKRAVKDYLIEQRRGSNNRVGLTTFSDEAYLAVSLTQDYDALISRIKEVQTEGSTAVGKAMMASISHFLELNIMQLDASDPSVAEMRKLVLGEDLAGALTLAKRHPGLMDKVLQPERTKILVLFTDGESNTGINPVEAAKIAKQLGIKIYTVGIQISGGETALKEVAAITGGLYFKAEDADGMRNALLDISRLEKSPALVRSQVSVRDLSTPLALLALLALSLEIGLVSTRLRSLPAFALAGLIGLSGVQAPLPSDAALAGPAIVQAQAEAPRSLIERLPLYDVPQSMAEGNALYLQGRYGDAVKRYGQALERHPDVPELYFNLGNAYLRLGDVERAASAYAKFLELNKDPKAASEAIYNLGNGALMKKDAEKAIELYREALRRDPTNISAKWNLESVMRLMEEQQKKDGQDGKQQKQKGKKGQKQQKGEKGDQAGQPGQKGDQPGDQEGTEGDKPSDQQGKPGDKQGKPGDKKGEAEAKPAPGEREKGVDGLIQEQGKAEQDGKQGQRNAVPKKGSGVWGFAAPLLGFLGFGSTAAGFAAPLWLGVALAVVPVLAAFTLWAVKKKIQSARALAPGQAPKDLRSWSGKGRFWTKFTLLLTAALGLAISSGDPVFGLKDTRLNFGGKDVVVAADVSASTLYAEDGRGARVEKELAEFVTRMEGTDRIGLVVFAGKPRTASPLSADYGTFEFKVSRLEREARGLAAGSDLGGAIEHAAKVFEGAKKVGERQRILIVVSDGDIFAAELSKAIDAARKAGVTIYAIGVGDPAGTRISVPKADGSGNDYIIDQKTGQPALSRLNEEPLRQLAAATGGSYFRSSEKASMGAIMGQVAELSKGAESDAIKTPRGISFIFLTPALLLLLLEAFLPGVPLLRGGRSKAKAPATSAFGLLAIPLGVWPQVLPFAAVTAVLTGLLLYDLVTRGALTRAVTAWLHRKAPAEGLDKDLFALFDAPGDGRERWRRTDHAVVRSFIDSWRSAGPESRLVMIRHAGADAELWREKLTAALLAEAAWPSKKDSDQVSDAVLAAVAKARRSSLLPLDPVITAVLGRRAELAWLDHPAVLRPLARLAAEGLDTDRPESRRLLESLAGEADSAVAAAARQSFTTAPPRAKASRSRRVAMNAAVAFLTATIAMTGAAAWKTSEFNEARVAAAATALSIFYADDLYLFTDSYSDARIPKDVLPVLKLWHATGKAAASDLARAIEVLRSSPDPKADNVLEALFKRADLLPFNDASETLLLRTLIERDNESVWRFLDEYMAANGENPRSVTRLVKMILIGAEIDSESVFLNSFHFLKSPNDQVRQEAAKSLRASLSAPERIDKVVERLSAAAKKHEADPILNMWVAFFALDRLAAPDARAVDIGSMDGLLSTALKNIAKADAARLPLMAQVKPGEEDKLPPPGLAQAFGLMAQSLDRASGRSVNIDPLSLVVRRQADLAAKAIIIEGRELFPELKVRLQREGIMLADPAPQSYSSEYEDYDDYHGHYGGRGNSSYVSPEAVYRQTYTQAQLHALAAAVTEARDAAGSKLTPQQREFADRALKSLEAAASAAEKAGMPIGGTIGEAAAADVNSILTDGHSKLPGSTYLAELRAGGLAPDARIGSDKDRSYRQTYSAAEILKLRAFTLELLARGETKEDGKAFPLNWAQKRFLADAVVHLEDALKKHYPGAAAQIPAEASAAALADFIKAAQAGDAVAVSKSLDSLKTAYAQSPIKDIVLARFLAAYPATGIAYNDAIRIQVLGFWLDRLSEADGAKLDGKGVLEALNKVAPSMFQAVPNGVDGYSLLVTALNKASASGTPAPALFEFAKEQLKAGAERTLNGTKDKLGAKAFESLNKALREGRLLDSDLKVRPIVKPVHLRALQSALAAAKAPAWTAPTIERLRAVAAAAGIPDGGSSAELAADFANEALAKGDAAFPGSSWTTALRTAGLAPGESYTPAQLRTLHAFVSQILASGMGWDWNNNPSELNAAQGRFLADAAEALDLTLSKTYPAEAAMQPSALGRLLAAAAQGDAAARAAASARLAAAGSPAEILALLDAAAERGESSAEVQKLAVSLLAESLSGRLGAALADKDESIELVKKLGVRLGVREQEAWNILAQAVERAPSDALKKLALDAVNSRAGELARELQKAPGAEARLIEAGIIIKHTAWSSDVREQFTQRHLRALQSEAAATQASKLTASLMHAAIQAGMPTGDAPADIAGEKISDIITGGHQLFPGSRFADELRAAKLLPPAAGTSFNAEKDVPLSWSKEKSTALRDFLNGVLVSGQGWDYSSGRRDLTPEEAKFLQNAVKALDKVIADYDSHKPQSKSMNGLAIGALAFGAAGLGQTPLAAALSGLAFPVLSVIAAAALTYAVWRLWKNRPAAPVPAPGPRLGPSEAVLARYKRLDIAAKRLASTLTEGHFRARLIGPSGLTFAELAAYNGEDRKAVNWKASAKNDGLLVNKYEVEKDMPLMLLIDLSASGEFAATGAEKREVIEDAAALLALTAARRGIRVGALLFSDRVEAFIPPGGGQRHAWEVVRQVIGAAPQGTGTDLKLALDLALGQFKSRAMVILLSDLLSEGWTDSMSAVAKRHDFRAIRVADPAELKPLPDAGLILLRDAETGAERWVDTSSLAYREAAAETVKGRERRLSAALEAAHTRPITLYTDADPIEELSREFLAKKAGARK